jgi:hypothetical protein
MNSPIVPDFTFSNFMLASLLSPIFMIIVSLLKEPLRQKINAGLIAVAGGAYINAGLMPFDQLFNVLLVFIAYKGLQDYKFIALVCLFRLVQRQPNSLIKLFGFTIGMCCQISLSHSQMGMSNIALKN